ncbi:peptide synthetase [Azospirillum sp. TSH7]|uniref:amino acid synthesis family protein n=1 Tax=unclassified Azospirillum TaxID=2630922 RepID=UPI000D615507|nr:peptide synthetase [Azospirillum sp. TSH20]PWC67782.1 peptide synthetase [Azospirillum sp. TSH7]QCG95087.1 amino acid synthesis family protein [Azospirillum sp. TSA2s]
MDIGLRKISTFIEETIVEGGKPAERPITSVVVAAVLRNPWAGQGFVENLRPEILRVAPVLGAEMTRRLVALMPAERIEAYGKAASVGVNGEIEHASALIHTLRFGNMFREAAQGTTFLSFTNTRNAPGALLALPMIHKTETGKRAHFLTANFQVPDAPGPDELLVAIGASDGSRAHPRIGDRFLDMEEMEAEKAGALTFART